MRWLMPVTMAVALLLSVVPLPLEWREWRPEFVALLVVYWVMYSPDYFGTFTGWACGLVYDIIQLSPLGYNSLGLLVIAYIAHLSYQRIRSYALWQQAFWVLVLVGIYQLFCHWVGSFLYRNVESPDFIYTAAVTAFLWPVLVATMRTLRMYFRIPQNT